MKSYRTLALKELLSQKVTSILILIAVVLSTMMTTIVGQSIGVLSAMREQQAIAIGGNRYATFLQMNADQLHALEQDERLSYVGKSIYMGSLELSPSLTLGLMEYWDDTAAIYPSRNSAACISQVVIFQYPCKNKFCCIGIAVRNVVAKIFLQ